MRNRVKYLGSSTHKGREPLGQTTFYVNIYLHSTYEYNSILYIYNFFFFYEYKNESKSTKVESPFHRNRFLKVSRNVTTFARSTASSIQSKSTCKSFACKNGINHRRVTRYTNCETRRNQTHLVINLICPNFVGVFFFKTTTRLSNNNVFRCSAAMDGVVDDCLRKITRPLARVQRMYTFSLHVVVAL